MKRDSIKIIFVAFIAGLLSWWLFSFTADDGIRGARRFFRDLMKEVEVQADTQPLERIFKAKKISTYFTKDFVGEVVSSKFTDESDQSKKISRKSIESVLIGEYRIVRATWSEILSEEYHKLGDGVELKARIRMYKEMPREELNTHIEFDLEALLFRFYSSGIGAWKIKKAEIFER